MSAGDAYILTYGLLKVQIQKEAYFDSVQQKNTFHHYF